MAEKTGTAAVVADALREADLVGDEVQQPSLFGGAQPLQRGPGRPKGSLNRTSAELRDYLQAVGADPALALARLMNADPKQMCRQLGCEPLDVVKLQVTAAKELLPYVRSRAPVEIHAKSEVMTVMFSDAPPEDREAGLVGRGAEAGPVLDLDWESADGEGEGNQ